MRREEEQVAARGTSVRRESFFCFFCFASESKSDAGLNFFSPFTLFSSPRLCFLTTPPADEDWEDARAVALDSGPAGPRLLACARYGDHSPRRASPLCLESPRGRAQERGSFLREGKIFGIILLSIVVEMATLDFFDTPSRLLFRLFLPLPSLERSSDTYSCPYD